jgi:hypothetical protein
MAILSKKDMGAVASVPPNFSERATLRVKKVTFAPSKSSGNNQFSLDCEIIAPEVVDHADGKQYVLAGQEIKFYLGLGTKINGNAKQSPLANTIQALEKLGLPTEIDTELMEENPEGGGQRLAYLKNFDNLVFDFALQSRDKYLQRKVGDEYQVVLDGRGNKTVLGCEWLNQSNNILGPSSAPTGGAF